MNDDALCRGLLIVSCFYNEEDIIDVFLDRLATLVKTSPVAGVVLVDDGSTDGTNRRVRSRNAFPAPIRLVELSRNFGHQNACVAGLTEALVWNKTLDADWIGLLDSDMQDQPEHFAIMLGESGGCDVVYAQRKRRMDGLVFSRCAALFHRFLSGTSRLAIPRDAGTFCIMRPAVVSRLCEFSDNDPYIPGLRAWVGFRQKGVPLERSARADGRSRIGYLGLVRLGLRAFVLYSRVPLDLAFYAGVGLAITTPILLMIVLMNLGNSGDAQRTFLIIMSAVQIVYLTIAALMVGLVAHMVSRVRDNTSRQPAWVVRSTDILP